MREEVAAMGVVYTDLESAMHGEYAEMIQKHFMKLVPPTDHKFAALHGAVWSGGSFVYVPKNVTVPIPPAAIRIPKTISTRFFIVASLLLS